MDDNDIRRIDAHKFFIHYRIPAYRHGGSGPERWPRGGVTLHVVTYPIDENTVLADFTAAVCSPKDIFVKRHGRAVARGRYDAYVQAALNGSTWCPLVDSVELPRTQVYSHADGLAAKLWSGFRWSDRYAIMANGQFRKAQQHLQSLQQGVVPVELAAAEMQAATNCAPDELVSVEFAEEV